MAHNIAFANGRYSAFTAGKSAWHKLGQNVTEAQSWEQAISLAGLDFEVSKRQLEFAGSSVEAWGIFRDDNQAFLGAVGSAYQPIQNRYAFDFVDTLLEAEDGSHYDSAGALGKGERFWVSARVPFDFNVGGYDAHQTYLLFASSHDGSMAATAKLSTVRVVCQNTLTQALNKAGSAVRVKHTADAQRRLDAARKLMSGVSQDVKSLEEKLNALTVRKMSRASMVSCLDRLFPKNADGAASQTRRENVLNDVLRLYENNDNNAFPEQKGTAYALLNAITGYVDHERSARITNGRKGMSESTARAENAVFGTGERLKQQALDVIMLDTAGNEVIAPPIYSVPSMSNSGLLDSILNASIVG